MAALCNFVFIKMDIVHISHSLVLGENQYSRYILHTYEHVCTHVCIKCNSSNIVYCSISLYNQWKRSVFSFYLVYIKCISIELVLMWWLVCFIGKVQNNSTPATLWTEVSTVSLSSLVCVSSCVQSWTGSTVVLQLSYWDYWDMLGAAGKDNWWTGWRRKTKDGSCFMSITGRWLSRRGNS